LRTRQPSSSTRLGLGRAQQLSDVIALDVLGKVEARDVLSDDLVRPVSFDALRTVVPGDDVPVRSEHEDRVVLYALHQQAKALFGRADQGAEPRRDRRFGA
jgi:hypothetical protein